MADIYRVRVQSLGDKYLTCRVTELYPDSGLFPSRTLCLHLLWDTVDGRTSVRRLMPNGDVAFVLADDFACSSPLGQALAGRYAYEDSDWNWHNVQRFISCVGVVDFGSGAINHYHRDAQGWHRTPENKKRLQATFNIAATDPIWFSHLVPDMEWESTAYCDDRHTPCKPAWHTPDVLMLARGIYDQHAFERMPILADALQDAGCDSDDLLNHLRDTSATHVRGCWALDLVLGKS